MLDSAGTWRPQTALHTHVAVSAKVCGTDGGGRALDARALYRMTVAASEAYNTAFEARLTVLNGAGDSHQILCSRHSPLR